MCSCKIYKSCFAYSYFAKNKYPTPTFRINLPTKLFKGKIPPFTNNAEVKKGFALNPSYNYMN